MTFGLRRPQQSSVPRRPGARSVATNGHSGLTWENGPTLQQAHIRLMREVRLLVCAVAATSASGFRRYSAGSRLCRWRMVADEVCLLSPRP